MLFKSTIAKEEGYINLYILAKDKIEANKKIKEYVSSIEYRWYELAKEVNCDFILE